MSEKLESTTYQPLMFSVADSRVKTCQLQENARGLLESGQGYGGSLTALLGNLTRSGLLPKMSPAFYPAIEGEILPLSFNRWLSGGMAFAGGYLTLNISALPNAAAVCSLSQVLETDVPQKYYLSGKACAGILRRAKSRGKALPDALRLSLETCAEGAEQNQTNL